MTLDFFTPIVEDSKLHPNFRSMIAREDDPIRIKFSEWAEEFVDRDGKIVKEFQTTFNSSFWEIYLHRTFIELGFSHNYSQSRPDFLITKNNISICIEAAISSHAAGTIPEWEADTKFLTNKHDLTKINLSAMLRHLNSIHKKHGKYVNEYSALSHTIDRPFVIALGAFDQPRFWLEFDRAIKAVLYDYYIDEQGDIDAEIIDAWGVPAKRLRSIKNKNGTEIPLGLFRDDRMKDVSAVLFNCIATYSKLRAFAPPINGIALFSYVKVDRYGMPAHFYETSDSYRELMQDGIHIFHNPYALNPLPLSAFNHPGIIQHYYSHIDKDMAILGLENFLASRQNHTCFLKEAL